VLTGKRVLLIVSGGIAAYKSLELIRRLRERRAAVRCILTRAGAQFVTPLSLSPSLQLFLCIRKAQEPVSVQALTPSAKA
jgi:phosphopantothenoylcysteine synthetase/decarboxylase